MPEPASAFSVGRESKTAVNDVCDSTSAGMPSRPTVWSSTACAGADLRSTPFISVEGRSARGSSPSGTGGTAGRSGRERRRAGGRAERVDHVDDRLRVGVDQVERLAVAVGQVGQVVHRLGDVVDRHHVGVAEVDADQRQPAGQVVAHPLQEREEVVGAVDLVHRAGLGVADHDRGPVDPPRHRRLARGRSSRTRTSCGGTARAGAAPRRTSSRRRCRGSHRRRPPTTPGGSSPPGAPSASSRACRVPPTFSFSLVASSAVMS